jgi:hypothetical protein
MTPPHQPLRSFPVVRAPKRVYRVARRKTPLGLRPWETVTDESPLSGRFDDSYGEYRVLYTSGTAEGAFRETLQRFRPSADLKRLLEHIKCEPGEDPLAGIGVVPLSWLTDRVLAVIETDQSTCVDLGESEALDVLSDHFPGITLGNLLGEATAITRRVSRNIFNRPEDYAGICMPSKFGKNIPNYAFFEKRQFSDVLRARLSLLGAEDLNQEHGAFVEVLNAMGLQFEGVVLESEDPREAWIAQYSTRIELAHEVKRIPVPVQSESFLGLFGDGFHVYIQTAAANRREVRITASKHKQTNVRAWSIAQDPIAAADETLEWLSSGPISLDADIVVAGADGEVAIIEAKKKAP